MLETEVVYGTKRCEGCRALQVLDVEGCTGLTSFVTAYWLGGIDELKVGRYFCVYMCLYACTSSPPFVHETTYLPTKTNIGAQLKSLFGGPPLQRRGQPGPALQPDSAQPLALLNRYQPEPQRLALLLLFPCSPSHLAGHIISRPLDRPCCRPPDSRLPRPDLSLLGPQSSSNGPRRPLHGRALRTTTDITAQRLSTANRQGSHIPDRYQQTYASLGFRRLWAPNGRSPRFSLRPT